MPRTPSQDARRRMLDAAAELALQSGLSTVTIDEVARRSGVAKTTIYRHFEDRNALLIAALDSIVEPPTAPDTGSLVGDLVAFLTTLQPLFVDPGIRILSLEVIAAAARDPELEALRATFFAGRMGPVTSVLHRAQERGELGTFDNLLDAIEIVQSPFLFRSLTLPDSLQRLDIEALSERIAATLIDTFGTG